MGVRSWLRRGRAHGRGGLIRPTVTVSVLLSLLIGAAFAVVVLAIDDLRGAVAQATESRRVLSAANRLQTTVLTIETGERGYLITGRASYLRSWHAARDRFAGQAAVFERLAASVDSGQVAHAHAVLGAADSYIGRHSVPVVALAQTDPTAARSAGLTEDGQRKIVAFQERLTQFMTLERRLHTIRRQRANADAQRATVAASAGVAGSMVLILGSGGFLIRSVIRPVRRASGMAERLAGGDLSVRMPENGPGEVGTLERSFNSMAGSLGVSQDELRRVAGEQAGLRRVATLVARGVPAPEIFGAVARELGGILRATGTAVGRYEADGTVTLAGAWNAPGAPGAPGLALPAGSRWPARAGDVPDRVRRTGRPVLAATAGGGEGGGAAGLTGWAHGRGVTDAAGSPIEVDKALWGVMLAFWATSAPPPAATLERMADFTELVATAIANAESRAQLIASRARVVAAADDARRRIERDLHDGTQQRLISLGLELRAVEADVPAGHGRLRDDLAHAAGALTEVVEELQEISRGLHPAILSHGGLGPALRALARRSGIPVDLDVAVSRRLAEPTEVAAYYVVSEALANAGKHARASLVTVNVAVAGGSLRISVRDNGMGGADPGRGSGLTGLRDRVEALGGRISVTSPPGEGTSLRAVLPASTG